MARTAAARSSTSGMSSSESSSSNPNRFAMSRRIGMRSIPITGEPPMARAAAPVMIPMGPSPWTTTDFPRPMPSPAHGIPGPNARSRARVPHAMGSDSAAIFRDTFEGNLNSQVWGKRYIRSL